MYKYSVRASIKAFTMSPNFNANPAIIYASTLSVSWSLGDLPTALIKALTISPTLNAKPNMVYASTL